MARHVVVLAEAMAEGDEFMATEQPHDNAAPFKGREGGVDKDAAAENLPHPHNSRRALLVGGAAGIAAMAAAAVAKASPASAELTSNTVVTLDYRNDGGAAETEILSENPANNGVYGATLAITNLGGGNGLVCSDNGNGEFGEGGGGTPLTSLVENTGAGADIVAVNASCAGKGAAVQASSLGTGSAVTGSISDTANTSPAILGSTAGTGSGLYGQATSATGVGVTGTSATGTGVKASTTSGVALSVVGKVTFSRSGVATVPAGKKAVKVTLAGVTASSLVLATPQKAETGVAVNAAAPAAGSFMITLTAAPTSALKVAWFVID